ATTDLEEEVDPPHSPPITRAKKRKKKTYTKPKKIRFGNRGITEAFSEERITELELVSLGCDPVWARMW
ncbi:hypothetical protein U1Q18_028075, partial [Sarracenia purpurea var. burkii]